MEQVVVLQWGNATLTRKNCNDYHDNLSFQWVWLFTEKPLQRQAESAPANCCFFFFNGSKFSTENRFQRVGPILSYCTSFLCVSCPLANLTEKKRNCAPLHPYRTIPNPTQPNPTGAENRQHSKRRLSASGGKSGRLLVARMRSWWGWWSAGVGWRFLHRARGLPCPLRVRLRPPRWGKLWNHICVCVCFFC